MATLENNSPDRNDKKESTTSSRRTPLLLGAVATALVVPALVATMTLAEARPAPSTAAASRSDTATASGLDEAIGQPATAAESAITATTVSAKKKSSTLDFSLAKVVKVAERYKGTRYRYGGATPAGFDCSGFTKYVYGKFGISLPHSARAQGHLGDRVARGKAKPGDIVVTSGGSHVGIYVGKHKFIDAPMPGQVVHVRTIYTSNYYIVRMDDDTHEV